MRLREVDGPYPFTPCSCIVLRKRESPLCNEIFSHQSIKLYNSFQKLPQNNCVLDCFAVKLCCKTRKILNLLKSTPDNGENFRQKACFRKTLLGTGVAPVPLPNFCCSTRRKLSIITFFNIIRTDFIRLFKNFEGCHRTPTYELHHRRRRFKQSILCSSRI